MQTTVNTGKSAGHSLQSTSDLVSWKTSPTNVLKPSLGAMQSVQVREIGMLTRSLIETEDALECEKAAHQKTREALARAEYEASQGYAAILSSTSWRITAPLRWVSTKLRR